MKHEQKKVSYVEVGGRLVPEDNITSGRRLAEISLVVVVAIFIAVVAPMLA